MEKENNHYVPRFILRKFGEKISTFNIKTKELKIGQKLEKVFATKNLYSLEIENLFNEKIESEFANLLNKKILNIEDECVFTRKELYTIKKFLLLEMFRVIGSEEFSNNLLPKTKDQVKDVLGFEEKNTEKLNPFEYWMQTLRCILESKDLDSVIKHPLATAKAVYWAHIYISGYISIWDSTNSKEEFIVMDQGMTSEHEYTRFMPPYNQDIIKKGYLINKTLNLESKNKLKVTQEYFNLLATNDFMSENMYLFTISKNRIIVLINPFFRLYDKNEYESTSFLPSPDIWPSKFRNRDLFLKNRNVYDSFSGQIPIFTEDDLFIYPIRQMNLEDVIYVNALIFDRIQNIVGFSEISGIRRSLIAYSASVNPRVDYSSFIQEIMNLGFNTHVNDNLKKIANGYSSTLFNPLEHKYIQDYLILKDNFK